MVGQIGWLRNALYVLFCLWEFQVLVEYYRYIGLCSLLPYVKELGASSVTPLLTERSHTITENRVERLERVVLAAVKQCNDFLGLHVAISFLFLLHVNEMIRIS